MAANANQFSLLGERRFAPFFITQFLGAANDNVFRNGLVVLIIFQGTAIAGMDSRELANVAGALFILPYFLFSAPAGQIADRLEKSRLIRAVKLIEIALMVVATIGLLSGQYALLLVLLFLMGCQSTLFGPVKYAYLPAQLEPHELIGGNALVESGTYMAIIVGLIIGSVAAGIDGIGPTIIAACLLVLAVLGYLASRQIPATAAADPNLKFNWNIATETWRIIGYARRKRSVFLSILGISWFWFYGSAVTLQLPEYTRSVLNGTETVNAVLLVSFIVGVGAGSLLCERLSGGRIELGLVPFGALGLTWFGLDLYLAQPDPHGMAVDGVQAFLARPGTARILADLALLGAFGGLYSVPLYAIVQRRSERQHLSRIIAANNILNALFMVLAAGLAIGLFSAGVTIPQLFLVLAIMNAAVAIYIFALLPEFMLRFLAWALTSLLYRIRVSGAEQIPDSGPAVVVANHVSFVDALVIGGAIRRPVRFVMYYKIFELPLMKLLFKSAGAIPIASAREDPELLEQSFERIAETLAEGELLCIFPEGGITRDGEIQRFRPGIETILARTPVPVVPMSVSGLWGSWFSRQSGGGLRKLPGRLFRRVEVRIGRPVPAAAATAPRLELLVRTLRGSER